MIKNLKVGFNGELYYIYFLRDPNKKDKPENRILHSSRFRTEAEARKRISQIYREKASLQPLKWLAIIVLVAMICIFAFLLTELGVRSFFEAILWFGQFMQ